QTCALPILVREASVPSGKRMFPPGGSLQVRPRSSDQRTTGPQCPCSLPASSRRRPSRPSNRIAYTCSPRKWGPPARHPPRPGSPANSHAPFMVPTATSTSPGPTSMWSMRSLMDQASPAVPPPGTAGSEVLQDGVGGAAAGGEGAVDGGVVAVVAADVEAGAEADRALGGVEGAGGLGGLGVGDGVGLEVAPGDHAGAEPVGERAEDGPPPGGAPGGAWWGAGALGAQRLLTRPSPSPSRTITGSSTGPRSAAK